MSPELSEAQRERQSNRHRDNGRYAKVNPCRVCNESAGVGYYSHHDTDGLINDQLLVLCKQCAHKYSKLPGPAAVKEAFQVKSKLSSLPANYELDRDQLLVITNMDHRVINKNAWEHYCEDREVHWGEQGIKWKVLCVIDAWDKHYTPEEAEAYYGGV